MRVSTTSRITAGTSNTHYCSNQPPLLSNPLTKLPVGSIHPRGWLKTQLDLMADGMVGHLTELSKHLQPDSIWLNSEPEAGDRDESGFWAGEDMPYWLRGFYDLAAITGRQHLMDEALRWIEALFSSQREDGYFGPPQLDPGRVKYGSSLHSADIGTTHAGFWSHALALDVLVHHYECTGDQRVISLMTAYFEYCRDLPDEKFMPDEVTIDRRRPCEMIPHLHWLYNHSRHTWLLDLATRFYKYFPHTTDRWPGRENMLKAGPNDRATRLRTDEWLSHHVVGFAHRFRYPGSYYSQSHARWHLAATDYWYDQHLATWGQQPRGIFGADEVIRPTYTDPRQGFETCAMVEFVKSFYILGSITGDPKYASRCEDIMLNHYPAAQTPDLKGLRYLTASNQPQSDASTSHEYANERRMAAYSPHDYPCCQHNVAMGWPWYAGNLWQATADNGLAAWLYAASEVTAQVGQEGHEVSIQVDSDYPFKGSVAMRIRASQPTEFPIYLRVPKWCEGFSVMVNGEKLNVHSHAQSYVRIERVWGDGDSIDIEMPMDLSITEWPRTGSVTVNRGPLSYSVRIEEEWRRCGGTDQWPEWELFPRSPWNYGLVIDREDPGASLDIAESAAIADQPWTVEHAPVVITAPARRIMEWKLENNTVQELRPSPILSNEPQEMIELIPLGCARLRMSCLPVIGNEPYARSWE